MSFGRVRLKAGIVSLIFFMLQFSAHAGGWYQYSRNDSIEKFVDVAPINTMYQLYALGTQGQFAKSMDGGFRWELSDIGTTDTMRALSVAYNYNTYSNVVIAVGNNGNVWRYDEGSQVWSSIDTLNATNFNTAFYDNMNSRFWIGGNGGVIYRSDDFGLTWVADSSWIDGIDVQRFATDASNIYMIGNRNDSTFINYRVSYMITGGKFDVADTIPNVNVIDLYTPAGGAEGYFSEFLLLGTEVSTGNATVWGISTNMYAAEISRKIFSGNLGTVQFIDGFGMDPNYVLWVTNAGGEIYESRDWANTWQKIYKEPHNSWLGPMIASNYDTDHARAFGANGIVLRYGFDILSAWPFLNDQLVGAADVLSINFSQIPNPESLAGGIKVVSSISGMIDFYTEYDAMDSSHIIIHLLRENNITGIPGEQVNVVIDSELFENSPPYNPFSKPMNYSFDFVPQRNSGFRWKSDIKQFIREDGLTNFVSGLFNKDDAIDWITYGLDTLYCFNGDTLNGQLLTKVYLPGLVSVDINMKTQLTTADLNNDGLLDLILYNHDIIYFLQNNSYGNAFNFSIAPVQYGDREINKVIPYNKNNNAQIDLLVLAGSLYTIFDVTLDNTSTFTSTHEIQTGSYLGMTVGDINRDGFQDLVLIDPNGSLIFWRGNSSEQFYADDKAYSGKQGYKQVRLADLDGNHYLEVVAGDNSQVDVYTLYPESGWDFYTYPMRTIAFTGNSVQDFVIQDFGGVKNVSEIHNYYDLALLTQDSIEVYENQTLDFHNYTFTAHSDKNVATGFQAKQILFADFTHDGLIDLCTANPGIGQFSIWRKFSWQPQILSLSPREEEVHLSWTPLPDSVGLIDYYRIMRDSTPSFTPESYTRETSDTVFTDYEVGPFESFWYSVQAVYNGGIESDWSEPMLAETFIELNGAQSGVLDQTTRPYLVKTDISVAAGQNLQILPGVRIGFTAQTGFDVYGGLQIMGRDTSDMVDLFPAEMDSLPWRGVHIHAGADTVYLGWCSVGGAETGLLVENRPLQMKIGGVMHNKTGIDFSGDSLFMENVICDSNLVAMHLGEQARAGLKNINILHSFGNSIVAEGQNSVKIRNAIIWANQLPVMRTSALSDLSISYSTVDSIEGDVPRFAVSHLLPVFMPPDSGFYRLDYMSPTIDAGDPNDDFSMEPQPNGGRINQGLFGNLFMATPSLQPRIRIKPRPVVFETIPGRQDTIKIFIHNFGFVPLDVSSVTLQNNDPHFHIVSAMPMHIAPGDSLPLALTFQPEARMAYRDTLHIINNDPHLSGGLYLAALEGLGANSPPVISGLPLAQAKIASLYRYQIQVTDADGDSLLFTPVELPQWLSVSASGLISGVPALGDSGLHHVTVNISDGFGGEALLSYDIQVGKADLKYGPNIVMESSFGPIIKESAVRFRFSIVDSNVIEGLTLPVPIRVHYMLRKLPDVQPISNVDTVAVNQITFPLLEDGAYELKIVTYYPADPTLQNQQKFDFIVRADQRSIIRYLWYMVSFPRESGVSWDAVIGRNDSSAILLRWDNTENKYLPVAKEDIRPGTAFWMMPLKEFSADISSIPRTFSETASIEITAGWNQIGAPRSYSTFWRQMQFQPQERDAMPFLDAVQQGYLKPAVFWFEQSKEEQGYDWAIVDSSTAAWPWKGYWLYAGSAGTLHFPVQPAYATDSIPSAIDLLAKTYTQTEDGWEWNIAVQSAGYHDDKNIFGISATPQVSVMEPPHMGDFCSVSFASEEGNLTQLLKGPFSDLKEVKTWDMKVAAQNVNEQLTISWKPLSGGEDQIYLYLVDLKNEQVIDMSRQNRYQFTPGQNISAFKIYVTQDESFKPQIIPLHFKLAQNYPNPFNPSTTIRVGVPQSADGQRVTLRIYDVLGRQVRTLWTGNLKMGYHEFKWNGVNDHGRRVASGIYFYRVKTASNALIKKMILMR